MTPDIEHSPPTPSPRARTHAGFFAQVREISELHRGASGSPSFEPINPTPFTPVSSDGGLKGGRGSGFVRCRNVCGHWHHQQSGSRRVIITHSTVAAPTKTASARQHLRYIQRDGTARDGRSGQLYSGDDDHADAGRFLARSRKDPHHFRLVISPQDGNELNDLTTYTRELMQQIQLDLGTEVDWVAANHYNTSHPHVHVVIGGRDDSGRPLLINGNYLCTGMRERAIELASLELGPLTVIEERRRPVAEIDLERLTALDRALIREADDFCIDLRREPGRPRPQLNRSLRLRRLAALEGMGLAHQIKTNVFVLNPEIEPALRARGERAAILRLMQDACLADGPLRDPMTFRIHQGTPPFAITGHVMDLQLTSALGHNLSVVVDGIDGRTHHVSDIEPPRVEDFRIGSIVEIGVDEADAALDRRILAQAGQGIYRPSADLAQARFDFQPPDGDHEGFIATHVRRLEQLEMAGIVARIDEDQWRIPVDLLRRTPLHDHGRNQACCRLLSDFDLSTQIHADGATWLDHRLLAHDNAAVASNGFGDQLRGAMELRASHHVEQGDAIRQRDGTIHFQPDLLRTLRGREVARVGREMAEIRALAFREIREGDSIRGRVASRLQLQSGRFAMIEMAREFTLVPWRPILERERSREIAGIMREGTLSWHAARDRVLEI
ncbi:MAG: DUF3363 domain-containing protein [Alphaproteobacteria bacterium]|nr:DUF3363 domain-containing protein [Alphaproteobacteria bacterium]